MASFASSEGALIHPRYKGKPPSEILVLRATCLLYLLLSSGAYLPVHTPARYWTEAEPLEPPALKTRPQAQRVLENASTGRHASRSRRTCPKRVHHQRAPSLSVSLGCGPLLQPRRWRRAPSLTVANGRALLPRGERSFPRGESSCPDYVTGGSSVPKRNVP